MTDTSTNNAQAELVGRLRSERFDGGIAEWIATMRQAAAEIERMAGEVERKDAALRWIMERAIKLRKGTDDWFELVEFEMFAQRALGGGE